MKNNNTTERIGLPAEINNLQNDKRFRLRHGKPEKGIKLRAATLAKIT